MQMWSWSILLHWSQIANTMYNLYISSVNIAPVSAMYAGVVLTHHWVDGTANPAGGLLL